MNWEEDLDIINDRKSATKFGRRFNSQTPGSPEEISVNTDQPESLKLTNDLPKSKKTGGWAEEGQKSLKTNDFKNMIEEERFQNEKTTESEDDIPIIPDIDDIPTDLNITDIKAPNITVKSSTYKELDNNLETISSGQINFGNLGDIDLTILTNKLYEEKEVQRCNDVWTMETLFEKLVQHSNSVGKE